MNKLKKITEKYNGFTAIVNIECTHKCLGNATVHLEELKKVITETVNSINESVRPSLKEKYSIKTTVESFYEESEG